MIITGPFQQEVKRKERNGPHHVAYHKM